MAVHDRHDDIRDEHVDAGLLTGTPQGTDRVRGDDNAHPGPFKRRLYERPDDLVVLDHEGNEGDTPEGEPDTGDRIVIEVRMHGRDTR